MTIAPRCFIFVFMYSKTNLVLIVASNCLCFKAVLFCHFQDASERVRFDSHVSFIDATKSELEADRTRLTTKVCLTSTVFFLNLHKKKKTTKSVICSARSGCTDWLVSVG
jgi:hypothetical protein